MRGAEGLWTKLTERPILPISLALVGLLLVGWLNWQMFAPFSRPVLAGDESGFIAAYDLSWSSELERGSFQLRESVDGERWSSPRSASGKVAAAAVKGERFFLLFDDFVGEYERRDRRRLRCHDLSAWDARFAALQPDGPDSGASGGLMVYGVDEQEGLLAVRVNDGGVALQGRVKDATGRPRWVEVEGTRGIFGGPPSVAELRAATRAPKVQLSTARVGSETIVLMLVPPLPPTNNGLGGPATADEGLGQKTLRWLRVSKGAGGELTFSKVDESLGKAVAACLLLEGEVLRLYRVNEYGASGIEQWTLGDGGFQKTADIAIEKSGFFQSKNLMSLTAASSGERQLVLAQLGGTLRLYITGEKGGWRVMAQLPNEALSLAYAWFGAVLGLSLLLVVAGLKSLRAQSLSWPEMSVPQLKDELRGIVELSHREAARRARQSEAGGEASVEGGAEAGHDGFKSHGTSATSLSAEGRASSHSQKKSVDDDDQEGPRDH